MKTDKIRYLAGTYFHADYDLEASEPLGVVRNFFNAVDDETVSELRREIVRVLSETKNDDELADLWLMRGDAYYDPRHDDLSLREWFASIVDVLDGK